MELKDLINTINDIVGRYPASLVDLSGKYPFLQTINVRQFTKFKDENPGCKLFPRGVAEFLFMYRYLQVHSVEDYANMRLCDYCHKGLIAFKNYTKGYGHYCSTSCSRRSPLSQERYKNTLTERYGDPHYNNHEQYKQTCMERYGCINGFQSEEIKKKCEETKLIKYNDKRYTNQEKARETCKRKYGYISPFGNRAVWEKGRATMIARYGVPTPMEVKEFKEKQQQGMIEKYGVSNPLIASVVKHYKESGKRFVDAPYSSKGELAWLNFLKLPSDFEHRQMMIGKYNVDGYVKEDGKTIVVYEFLGDYYHGHPRMKKAQPQYEDLFEKRFNKTLERLKFLFEQRCVVYYIWEHDWNHDRHLFGRLFDGYDLEWDEETAPMNYPLYMYPYGNYPHHIEDNPYLLTLDKIEELVNDYKKCEDNPK